MVVSLCFCDRIEEDAAGGDDIQINELDYNLACPMQSVPGSALGIVRPGTVLKRHDMEMISCLNGGF